MFKQIGYLVWCNLRSIPNNTSPFIISTLGICGCALVLIGFLSVAQGFIENNNKLKDNETILILRNVAATEMDSWFVPQEVGLIRQYEHLRRSDDKQYVSSELYVTIGLQKSGSNTYSNVPLRGVSPSAFNVRKNLRVIEGRNFNPGSYELVVGKLAADQYSGLTIGSTKKWGKDTWTVVGIMNGDDGVSATEVWGDEAVVRSTFERGGVNSVVRVLLKDPELFDEFNAWISTHSGLDAKIVREFDYYSEKSEFFISFVNSIGIIISSLIALAVFFGTINVTQTIMSNRRKEIATYRAIGFSDKTLVASSLIETFLIGMIGGVIAALIAFYAIDGYKFSTLTTGFTQSIFTFQVTSGIVLISTLSAGLLGLFTGILPCYKIFSSSVSINLKNK